MVDAVDYDVLFCGGGLASGLAAYRLATTQPYLKIAIIEAGPHVGGNHTWSFHATDLNSDTASWLAPFIIHQWSSQCVRFPDHGRTLSTGYRAISSKRFAEILHATPNLTILHDTHVTEASSKDVDLVDGRRLSASAVLDGRGHRSSSHVDLGFQKFLGQEIRFSHPHGLDAPIIMDATVPQTDGYRFVYVLPFDDRTALIEDTYYADVEDLDHVGLRENIASYAQKQGWVIEDVLREEDGVLPIILDGDIDALWAQYDKGPVPIGMRAALFNPVTGYSLPDAVRVADLISNTDLNSVSLQNAMYQYAVSKWRSDSFYRMLNRMLFRAARPEQRWSVLQRFYRLGEPLIERFYAGQNSWQDKLRILAGKPPVPIRDALQVIRSRKTKPDTTKG